MTKPLNKLPCSISVHTSSATKSDWPKFLQGLLLFPYRRKVEVGRLKTFGKCVVFPYPQLLRSTSLITADQLTKPLIKQPCSISVHTSSSTKSDWPKFLQALLLFPYRRRVEVARLKTFGNCIAFPYALHSPNVAVGAEIDY